MNKLLLVPKSIKSISELRKWMASKKKEYPYILGIRKECKIARIGEFAPHRPRWISYLGVPIYYNY